MAIRLSDNIRAGVTAPLDYKYGPYTGITSGDCATNCFTILENGIRYNGLTVGFLIDGSITEYWFKDGVTNDDLVPKSSFSSLLTGSTYGEFLYWSGSTWNVSNTSIYNELEQRQEHENGFVNRTDSTLSFDNITRTFKIEPTTDYYEYYNNSKLHRKTTSDSVIIPDIEGLYYIYFDGDILKRTALPNIYNIITNNAFIAVIYWDYDNKKQLGFGDERHGCNMDSATHIYNHLTFGTRYERGLTLGNMSVDGDGDNDSDAQFSFNDGVIWDEDININIINNSPQDLSPISKIPMYYNNGFSSDLRRYESTDFPLVTGGTGRAVYNENDGGNWVLTEITNGDFVLTHYFASNNIDLPIIGFIGQKPYLNRGDARLGAKDEIYSLSVDSISKLTPEFLPIATVIWRSRNTYNNGVKSKVVSTDDGGDYINWLVTKYDNIGSSVTPDRLSDLSDTTIINPTDGETLTYSGDTWLNKKTEHIENFTGAGLNSQTIINITHNLGKIPNIIIMDNSNEIVYAKVYNLDENDVSVGFNNYVGNGKIICKI